MNSTEKTIETTENPLQTIGNKHGVRGLGTMLALGMIENAVINCPEDVVTDDEVTAAIALQLGKRIAHYGGEEMAREFLEASIKEIRDFKAMAQS